MTAPEGAPAYIVANEVDEWECTCGNKPYLDGFYPCDENGNEVEPGPEYWNGLLVCGRCHLIADQTTYDEERARVRVVGRFQP